MEKKIMAEKTNKDGRTDENVIYVGNKPAMSYVLAVITQFNDNGSTGVCIKARGKSISTAVDTAEIVRNRFLKDVKIKKTKIGTKSVTNMDGREINV
jgi:DNA-binding protein